MIRSLYVRSVEELSTVDRTNDLLFRSATITGRMKILWINIRVLLGQSEAGKVWNTTFIVEGTGLERRVIDSFPPGISALDAKDGRFPGAGIDLCGSLALIIITSGTRPPSANHIVVGQAIVDQY